MSHLNSSEHKNICIRNLDPGLIKAQKCGEVIKPIGCMDVCLVKDVTF